MKYTLLKKIILYTALILNCLYVNANQTRARITPITVSEPQVVISSSTFYQSIELILNNFIFKSNSSFSGLKSELIKFQQTQDNTIQAIVMSRNHDGTTQFETLYTIIADNQIENNQQYIAKFIAETKFIAPAPAQSLLTLAQQLKLSQIGYFTTSGDIVAAVKSTVPIQYDQVNPQNQSLHISLPDASLSYQTDDTMQMLTTNLFIPHLNINHNDLTLITTDINLQQNENQFDNNFAYTGNQNLTAASMIIDKPQMSWWLKTIVINIQKQLDEHQLFTQKSQISLQGIFDAKGTDLHINFDLSGNVNIDNINIQTFKQLEKLASQYAKKPVNDQAQLINMMTQILTTRSTFELKNTELTIANKKGLFNILVRVMPTEHHVNNSLMANLGLLQYLNNIDLQASMVIPAQWLLIFGLFNDQTSLDQAIKQYVEQANILGLDGMLSYDNQNIALNFEIKNGVVWLNGQAKVSLLNLLPLFIQ